MLKLVTAASSVSGSVSRIQEVRDSTRAVDGCARNEAVMLRGAPARSDQDVSGPRGRTLRVLLTTLLGGTRVALAVGLLAGLGWQGLWAQDAPRKLIVQRSTRAIPHRFIVHPSEVTVAVNQMQHFEVTDAQGNPVAVRWNVSGLGCSGLDCGTINDAGDYRTPSSLPRPRVVTLEGVLVSDPNYSVLAEVVLEDAVAARRTPASAPVSSVKKQALTAPEVERRSLARNAESMPLPNVVGAAPLVGVENFRRSTELPTPTVIAAAPAVGRQNLAHSADLPTPNVIAAAPAVAAPSIGRQNLAPGADLPQPNVIAAPPSVGTQKVARSADLPMPNVIAAAPAVAASPIGRQKLARSADLPTTIVIATAPAVARPSIAASTVAASTVGREKLTRSAELPASNAIAAPPSIAAEKPARSVELPTPNVVAALTPITPQVTARTTTQFAAPVVGQQSSVNGVLPPMPEVASAVPAGTAVSAQHGPVVTYREGQLTIDAENLSLATVLKLIEEKTGAVIDIPPGTALEKIFEHTGPGPVNDVLERLLNGSPFNFIIVNSPQHPNLPAQVLLSLRGADTPVLAASDQTSAASPKPPASMLYTPIEFDRSALAPPPTPSSPSGETISRDALEQMMKDRIRRANEQFQKPQ